MNVGESIAMLMLAVVVAGCGGSAAPGSEGDDDVTDESLAPAHELYAHSPTSPDAARIELHWRLPDRADGAVACWVRGEDPPEAPGGQATCKELAAGPGEAEPAEPQWVVDGKAGEGYAFAVFARYDGKALAPAVTTYAVAQRLGEPIRSRIAFEDTWIEKATADDVEVCWVPEDENHLKQYVIRVRDQAGGPTRTESTMDQCYRLEGLTAGRTYDITVVARTDAGDSFPQELTATTRH